jgi:two-component system, NarL family, nitrate/nitrite response regulator NarL
VDRAALNSTGIVSASLANFRRESPLYPLRGELTQGAVSRGEGCAVLVAMPDDLLRCGLAMMLGSLPTVADVISCESTRQAIEELERTKPSIAVVTCNDLACCNGRLAVKARQHGTKVLVLLEHPYGVVEHCSADCPADGFLLQRNLTLAGLDNAILRLMQGEMPVPTEVARELLASARRGDTLRTGGVVLTPRERQALNLMARGLGNKQIARELGISEHGAKRHVSNVLAKLNSPNRTSAVAKAMRDGLLDETELN